MDPHGHDQEILPTLRAELRERSKELGFLHHATRLINMPGEPRDLLRAVLELLPSAMCYPELAGARICLGPLELRTPGFERTELSLHAEFDVMGEGTGSVEVCYAGEPPAPVFLEEEQSLLGSLAELLRGHFERLRAQTAYQRLMQADAKHDSEQLLDVVSRELRCSLQVIRDWIQASRRAPQGPGAVAQGLQSLERKATLQSKLVEALLDRACIRAGTLQLDGAVLDLAEIVGAAVAGQQAAAEAKPLQLSARVERVGYVLGDRPRLQQLLSILLGNAVEFCPSGGSIQVALSAQGSKARLVVTDAGVGIEGELPPIAHHLIELHQGTLAVRGHRPEPGMTIEIELPLQTVTATSAPKG